MLIHAARRLLPALLLTLTSVALATACGEDTSDSDGGADADAGVDSAPPGLPMENTGDCTTGKWADVSDACWACMCETCADTTNACDESCQAFMVCQSSQCFVGSQAEMQCEIRCAMSTCASHGLQAGIAAGDLDSCLIAAGSPDAGAFRRCEAECGFEYSGTVCDNY